MAWLNIIGAIITFGMGCLGLFLPTRAAALTGLTAATVEARAEFRGTLGVTFLALGAMPLLTGHPLVYLTVGLAWAGAALGRLVSIVVDGGNSAKNWGATAFELLLAASLCVGAPLAALAPILS